MKAKGIHEGCIEQIQRLFATRLYQESGAPEFDEKGRIRMDDWELQASGQDTCKNLWSQITSENVLELTDYSGYQQEFLRLFGFGIANVNYEAPTDPDVTFDVINL